MNINVFLGDDILHLIFQYLPITLRKFCDKSSYQQYYLLYLPENSSQWNLNYLKKNYQVRDEIEQVMSWQLYSMIIHNIYRELIQKEFHTFFQNHPKNYNRAHNITLDDWNEKEEEVLETIYEYCPFSNNYDFQVLPKVYHLYMQECLLDVLNHRNFCKWLIKPEKKNII